MRTWTTTTTVDADRDAVLDVLTDPEACRRWAPVPFDVSGLEDDRLLAGSRARVTGKLAGRAVGFDVHVHEASADGVALSANGPVAFDVRYDLAPATRGSEVRASVAVRPGGGLLGRVLTEATAAMLSAGMLDTVVSRLAREALPC
ncbi:MAG TPA: SRPBCC family protein [Solirubrobacteraceae bacterium]